MPKLPALPPPGFKALPVEKKIEYVQKLWGIIAADAEQVPVPAWHKKILDERSKSPSPRRAQPWSQVRREIETALRLADWQKRLLDERIADHRARPELARPWSEVRLRVLRNLRSRRRRTST